MVIFRKLSYSINRTLLQNVRRGITSSFSRPNHQWVKPKVVLGIETSCDDTGAAVVDTDGQILGESLYSQSNIHIKSGGINPRTAQSLHREQIENVVNTALKRSGKSLQELDAIAVTVEPGLSICLGVGVGYAKELVAQSGLPMIPIHHMQAHALTARMLENIEFPFLVLLISGGHCILTVAQDVNRFLMIGNGLDTSPGDCLEKVARKLNLKSLPQCENLNGGAAIELLTKGGDPHKIPFSVAVLKQPSCNFSFSGLRSQGEHVIELQRKEEGISEDEVISDVTDFCASLQYCIAFQICRRLQRAFIYCQMKDLLPSNPTLVVSGGVASNQYIRKCLQQVCGENSARLICPPPKLCTDNGIMIAWNGVEKLKVGQGISKDPQSESYRARSLIGEDITENVTRLGLKIPPLKLKIQP
ncbi:tRNA N6-adenosine threonylcarbamoyltransferase, mitochondrial-like [Saccostrea echinata]|uniref:tRNA N6-adenosine threonylcarbamoyltransferase, mitochondrial-like n=1 Tax=Saccostrea echinata TaxID=191078 RepID=UPI002A8410F0|nr:tRNA N6-adenosine threonylcarbamoyltransferase, mitochondrial-like [Saccostrea echinata]